MVILTPFLAGRTSQSAWRTGRGQTRGSPASTTSSWPCSQSSSASPWKAGRPSSTGWVSFDNNFHFQSHPHPRNWCRCHCPDCLAESRLAPIWSPTIYHSNFKSFPRKSHTKYQILGAPLKLNVEICQKICCFFCFLTFLRLSSKVCLRNLFSSKCELVANRLNVASINLNFSHSSSKRNLKNLTNPNPPIQAIQSFVIKIMEWHAPSDIGKMQFLLQVGK